MAKETTKKTGKTAKVPKKTAKHTKKTTKKQVVAKKTAKKATETVKPKQMETFSPPPSPPPITEIKLNHHAPEEQTHSIPALNIEPGPGMGYARTAAVEMRQNRLELDKSSFMLCGLLGAILLGGTYFYTRRYPRGLVRGFISLMLTAISLAVPVLLYILNENPELLGIKWTY